MRKIKEGNMSMRKKKEKRRKKYMSMYDIKIK
jgi:hypothetical protein